jgi:hypothetical protein
MKYGSYIKDGFLAWTLTSNGYKYLTWNMALHWKQHVQGVPLLVVCSDKASHNFLSREGISCILIDDMLIDYGPQIVPFGSRQFSVLNRLKLRLLTAFASDSTVQQCLYLDGDIIVYKDIVVDIKERLQEAPLLFQCDEKQSDCSSISTRISCPNVCTGLIAWNHGGIDKSIFQISDEAVWSEKPEDQVWVNYMLRTKQIPVSVLSRILYPNGARVSLTKNTPELAKKAICLHYNYRVGGTKKSDMKRFGDWCLPY